MTSVATGGGAGSGGGHGVGEGGVGGGVSVPELSQLPLLPGDTKDAARDAKLFPDQNYDVNHQQLDLRTQNSWLLKLEDLQLPEVVEVFSINTIAPLILNSRLKPLMAQSGPLPRAEASGEAAGEEGGAGGGGASRARRWISTLST